MERTRSGAPFGCAVLCVLVLASCGGGDVGEPQPERLPLPQSASLIPVAPAPHPGPTPTPEATGETWATPPGGGSGGRPGSDASSGACGAPAPPPLARFSIHPIGGNGERVLLDSTPLVGPDGEYCRSIGFTDGRLFCAVRQEGHPERSACESALVGLASDTGRFGPTWTVDGRPCDGSGDRGSCVNHSSNQYLVYAYGAGTFRACSGGACGEITLP